MSTFVLIHDAWHGGWCWYKVATFLERQGHTVVTPDLPGQGRDKTPLSMVSLPSHVESVCNIVDAQREPVALVGHGMGGGTITQAAEYLPGRIKMLVYVAALLPKNGEVMFDLLQRDTESLLSQNMEVLPDQSGVIVREAALKEVFYADCCDEDVALAKRLLVPQPIALGGSPLETTEANFGRIPRGYIECRQDRACTLSFQRRMYTSLPCQTVISMDSGHSPFFSAPGELGVHLTSL